MIAYLHSIMNENDTIVGRLFDWCITFLIILSIILLCVDTFDISEHSHLIIDQIEIAIIVIFTIEWLLRATTASKLYPDCPSFTALRKFTFSPYSIIDLLTILPFYLALIFPIGVSGHAAVRALRLIRLLKATRYSKSIQILLNVFRRKKGELLVTVYVSTLILFLISTLMYYAEHEAQPEVFHNILDALWWGTATLTTVGYGDIAPVTGMGRLIASIGAFLGIGVFALPTAILGAGFIEEFREQK